jgi:hypothetical protein
VWTHFDIECKVPARHYEADVTCSKAPTRVSDESCPGTIQTVKHVTAYMAMLIINPW